MEKDPIRLKANAAGSASGMWLHYLILFGGFYLGMAMVSFVEACFPYADLNWLWFLLLLGIFACLIGNVVVIFIQWAWIEKDGVCVTFGKKPVWGMAASQLRFIAMVGGDMGNFICLSAKTIDELAELREQQLLKNWFSKDEVPLRKRRAEWRQNFAKEYLLKGCGKGLFAAMRPSGLVMLAGNTSLLTCIRAMYPNVPYYNMTATGDSMNMGNDPTRIPLFYDTDYYAHLREDGVHICHYKKEIGILPKSQIKTIVCMHDYCQGKASTRYGAAMICSQTVEELAAAAPSKLFGAEIARLGMDEETVAMICCLETFRRWRGSDLRMCPVQDNPDIRQQLQEYYPDAKWVDLSDRWLNNSP